MAIQPNQDQSSSSTLDDLSIVGPDATAAFEPANSPDSTAHASSENLMSAPRVPALDEEDEVEDDDPEKEDEVDDADDTLEDDDDEDEDLDDEDDELEDDEDEDADDDEDEEDEEEEEEDEE